MTERRGDAGTRGRGDGETRRPGDGETRRRGDAGTERRGDAERRRPTPRPPVPRSPRRGGEADGAERLQKILAAAGIASRRHAEELIRAGRVTVNGTVAELGSKADPARDAIALDGRPIQVAEPKRYLLLHKPAGYITTLDDPQGRPTVVDLLPAAERRYRLFPVGRLDRESEGLVILTNDGELAYRLTHPKHELEKEYLVAVEGRPSDPVLARLRRGIPIEGEPTAPAEVDILPGSLVARAGLTAPAAPPRAPIRSGEPRPGRVPITWLRVVIHEGRKRQIRRMLESVGHPVLRLIRVRVGPITLGRLPPGQTRPLTTAELATLRGAVGLS